MNVSDIYGLYKSYLFLILLQVEEGTRVYLGIVVLI